MWTSENASSGTFVNKGIMNKGIQKSRGDYKPRLEDSVLLLITFGGLLSSHPRSSQGRFRFPRLVPAKKVLAW
jgi:hypothetical protein